MKRLKKFLSLCLPLVLILISFSACSVDKSEKETGLKTLGFRGDYDYIFNSSCKVEKINAHSRLYINGDVVYEGYFCKFACLKNRYIVLHNIITSEGSEYTADDVSEFLFMDMQSPETPQCFTRYSELIEYIGKKGLSADKWIMDGGWETKNIHLNKNSYIEDSGENRGQILFINNEPVFGGIIDEYASAGDNYAAVHLSVVDFYQNQEFKYDTNKNLDFEKFKSNKKYGFSFSLYNEAFYQSYILINTKNLDFKEYRTKADLEASCKSSLNWVKVND